jgi:hypothetical protein
MNVFETIQIKLFLIMTCGAAIVALALAPQSANAQVSGKISGTVRDQTGAVIPNAAVLLQSPANGMKQTTNADSQGTFAFPLVSVGTYSLDVNADGFTPYHRENVAVDLGSAAQFDVVLHVASRGETVNVTENGATVETSDTQLGQVISSTQITAVPLNGRSYTDLLAVQAGVNPITTSGQSNNTSGGSFGYVPVSGGLTTGQFSVHGQRESANGFFLNGVSVQEAIGQQAGIIPNLDSIAEFRILTGNSDAQYGGYSGGLINVVTKSGSNVLHGSLFEFLRNRTSTPGTTFRPSAPPSSRTSSEEPWAAHFEKTSCSFSPITKASTRSKDRKPVSSTSPPFSIVRVISATPPTL